MPGICYPQNPPSSPLLFSTDNMTDNNILLLSGLDLSNNPNSLHYQLLIEWINGMAGNDKVQHNSASIAQIIIAGK